MAVKTFRPITPARRYLTVADFSGLTPKKKQPKKPRSLFQPLKNKGGRNSYGRITIRHQGGGHKRKYRVIDFLREKRDIPARVASLECNDMSALGGGADSHNLPARTCL